MTIEDNAIAGGAGSAVGEYLAFLETRVHILHIGHPDKFISHGSRKYQLNQASLDTENVKLAIQKKLDVINC